MLTLASASALSGHLGVKKNFQRYGISSHRAWTIATLSIRLSAASRCKAGIVGLQRSRGDWLTPSTEECDRLEGAQEGPHPHVC